MEEKKRVLVSVPAETNKTLEILSLKMDETKGKVVKVAVDAFAKKVL